MATEQVTVQFRQNVVILRLVPNLWDILRTAALLFAAVYVYRYSTRYIYI